MNGIDFTASRLRWHDHILRWSNGGKAVLRRTGSPDRLCVACVSQFSPRERQGMVSNPEDRKARLSALAPDLSVLEPPDQERDRLVVFNPDGTEQPGYRIVSKPGREEPTAGITIFWSLQVRR